ncbi:response regulator transcription factor [Hahella sp. CR1]|uniref:response regulator transcription factor n=1 Tax=Hahella sp. CR1 TaxID=2992807 RepID=UPI0024418684|nr:response regulator transcription factor [Hahella sp. CR1]MDG9669415.1 response regulator transcription factor [Hahella sp. CR1]
MLKHWDSADHFDTSKLKVLLVEDQKPLAENIFEFLGDEKYSLDFAADGLTAQHLLATSHYDVIILDIMLPGLNGLALCRIIRRNLGKNTPIILISAKTSIEDKEEGFNSGADDYLVKPFNLYELEMRVRALCRRNFSKDDSFIAEDLRYSPGMLTLATESGQSIVLTGYNATIFETLIRSYPVYASFELLSEQLWGHSDGASHTIRTHVYTLRKALKSELGRSMILTVHGRGYRLSPQLV